MAVEYFTVRKIPESVLRLSNLMPSFSGNIFVEQYGKKLGQIWQSETPEKQIDAIFDSDCAKYLDERSFGKSDGTNEFWFSKQ